nr:MAG TPA: hypothetical protein [Caudoviricetes sp.]
MQMTYFRLYIIKVVQVVKQTNYLYYWDQPRYLHSKCRERR